jgi:hypothetical protein
VNVQYRWNKSVEAIEMDGDWVILHANHNTITRLNRTGGVIWSLLQDAADVESIVSTLTNEYDVEPNQVASDVVEFICALRHVDVVTVAQ